MTELHLAMSSETHRRLTTLLLRNAPEEEICFALVAPSTGYARRTLIVREIIEPQPHERSVHGNVSFSAPFVNRAIDAAIDAQLGLALVHSHPFGSGFQSPSPDDIRAERRTLEVAAAMLPRLPVLGAILAGDGSVSCREYRFGPDGVVATTSAATRIVGPHLRIQSPGRAVQGPRPEHASHIGMLGAEGQQVLARTSALVVGGGSVGSWVAIQLARLGVGRIGVLDYDEIERKNLNRLASEPADVGKLKVDVLDREVRRASTADGFVFERHVASIVEAEGVRHVPDYDVVFSCADSHWSRQVIDYAAYAHLVPVIDGGTAINSRGGSFQTASCRAQPAGPGRGCLCCGGAYDPAAIGEEMADLVVPHYGNEAGQLGGEPSVIALNMVLAGYEVLRFMEIVLGVAGQEQLRVQRFDYREGDTSTHDVECADRCPRRAAEGRGDLIMLPVGVDPRFARKKDAWHSASRS